MSFRDTIRRTECSCSQCQVGCRSMPGMLAIGDLEKIAAYFAQKGLVSPLFPETFIEMNFVASEGAKVGKWNGRTLETFEIKTITPAQRPNGECVFYCANGECGIHPVSPLGCACVDSHQSREEGDAVIHPALAEIFEDQQGGGRYSRIHAALEAAGRVARPRAERRAAFEWLYAQEAARMAPVRPDSPLEA